MSQFCSTPERPIEDGTYLVSVPPSLNGGSPELYLGFDPSVLPSKEVPIVTLRQGKVSAKHLAECCKRVTLTHPSRITGNSPLWKRTKAIV